MPRFSLPYITKKKRRISLPLAKADCFFPASQIALIPKLLCAYSAVAINDHQAKKEEKEREKIPSSSSKSLSQPTTSATLTIASIDNDIFGGKEEEEEENPPFSFWTPGERERESNFLNFLSLTHYHTRL